MAWMSVRFRYRAPESDILNLCVKNSFMVRDVDHIREIVTSYYNSGKLSHSRTVTSYVVEWHAHNVLYYMGLFRSHTADVDLNDDETKVRLAIYQIIWCFSTKHEEDLCDYKNFI